MSSIWDAAETLIALVGDPDAAVSAARGMAEDCIQGRRRREAAYWQQVAWAVACLANPQPLIAPDAPPAPGSVVRPWSPGTGRTRAAWKPGTSAVAQLAFAAKLPVKRASLLRLRKQLRRAWARHQGAGKPGPHARKPEPDGKA